jgi:hypothetical protein
MPSHDDRFDNAKFPLGRLTQTSAALATLSPEDVIAALKRHAQGDWGELDPEDRQANEQALIEGSRLLSVYRSAADVRFYVITEWDRSLTTVLLPEDY